MAAPVPSPQTQDPPVAASSESLGTPWNPSGAGMFPLYVHAAWDETPTLRGLLLGGPAALIRQYQTPGQYLELVHAQAGSAYFAIAAAPEPAMAEGVGALELLVRRGPGLAGVLAELVPEAGNDSMRQAESPLRTHGVRGAGFALAEQAGRDLILVAAGSGIAPLRAALQVLQQTRSQFGRIALYYGERFESDFAYRQELLALRAAAMTIELTLTRPPATWRGGTGYVQTHLRAQPPDWLGPNTTALLCGQPAMLGEVTAMLIEHHVPPAQILLNY